jgi:hypothetical protein
MQVLAAEFHHDQVVQVLTEEWEKDSWVDIFERVILNKVSGHSFSVCAVPGIHLEE